MSRKHTIPRIQRKALIKKVAAILSQGYTSIAAAYLFGSFLNREQFHDIDLAILTYETPAEPIDFELNLEIRLEKVVRLPVDVRLLNAAPLSFCQNVIRHGRVLIDRAPNLRAEFESRILRHYFDFSYFRRRYLKEVGNAPI